MPIRRHVREDEELGCLLDGGELLGEQAGFRGAESLEDLVARVAVGLRLLEVFDQAPVGELYRRREVAAARVAPAVDADHRDAVGEPDLRDRGHVRRALRGARDVTAHDADVRAVVVVIAEHEVDRRDLRKLGEELRYAI
jgi:hypothetical protein